ncbi:MAG: hypothetical protein HRU12_23805, partial [Phaeodactylibacter sp.]|nr:hypothetical protein [Phaeodactylibacter sp.]
SVAIAWTGQILIDSIPKVYDSTRQVRILGEDGSQEMLTLNETFIDSQTGEPVTLNDLSQGNYDVTCEMGAAYKNRQQEAVETFIRATERDPAAMELGRDILYKNIDAPGFDDLAERARAMLIAQDALPMEQLTQEERQWLEQQQAQQSEQDPQQDPNFVLAQAEMLKGQADMMAQQNKQAEIQLKAADVQAKYQGQTDKLQSETALNLAKVQQGQQKLDQEAAKDQANQQLDMLRMMIEQQKAQGDQISKLASALSNIKSAIGADVIMTPEATQAYSKVAGKLNNETE